MENNLLNDENTPSATSLLSGILEKYGLYENADKLAEKFEKGELSNLAVINSTSNDFANNKISDKELSTFLQNRLTIPEGIAKKIATEIQDTVLPMLKVIIAKRSRVTPSPEVENDITPPSISEKTVTRSVKSEAIETETTEAPKIPKKTEKKIPEANKTIQKQGPDSYREPIE